MPGERLELSHGCPTPDDRSYSRVTDLDRPDRRGGDVPLQTRTEIKGRIIEGKKNGPGAQYPPGPLTDKSPAFEHRFRLLDKSFRRRSMIFRESGMHMMGRFEIEALDHAGSHGRTVEVFFHVAVSHRWTSGQTPR